MRHPILRLLCLTPVLPLVLTACSGGGGGGGAQLRPGVTLTADYSVETRVTAIEGSCASTVGQVDTGTVAIEQSGSNLTVEPGTADAQTGTLNGLSCRFVASSTAGTVTSTSETTVTFAADGTSFTGSGQATETDSAANTSCVESFTIRGTRIGGGASTQAFVQAVTVNGQVATLQSGPLPAPTGGPAVTATGAAAAPVGGTTQVQVNPAAAIDALAVAVEGASGHWLVPVAASSAPQTVVLLLSETIPSATFRCQYQGRSGSSVGAPSVIQVSRTDVGTGVLQIALSWDTDSDLDLRVLEPGGFVISYEQPQSSSGGRLDLDGNADCEPTLSNENVTYPTAAPNGQYFVYVDHFENCSGRTSNYVVRVNQPGRPIVLRQGSFASSDPGTLGSSGVEVYRFTR